MNIYHAHIRKNVLTHTHVSSDIHTTHYSCPQKAIQAIVNTDSQLQQVTALPLHAATATTPPWPYLTLIAPDNIAASDLRHILPDDIVHVTPCYPQIYWSLLLSRTWPHRGLGWHASELSLCQ